MLWPDGDDDDDASADAGLQVAAPLPPLAPVAPSIKAAAVPVPAATEAAAAPSAGGRGVGGGAGGAWETLGALLAELLRVSGGPVYLLLAAASPLGFRSAANGSVHGETGEDPGCPPGVMRASACRARHPVVAPSKVAPFFHISILTSS